jgi:hypothetical protein
VDGIQICSSPELIEADGTEFLPQEPKMCPEGVKPDDPQTVIRMRRMRGQPGNPDVERPSQLRDIDSLDVVEKARQLGYPAT